MAARHGPVTEAPEGEPTRSDGAETGAAELESGAPREPGGRTVDPAFRQLEEERDFLLRSLTDLEAEHDAHDIDDVDYQTLKEDYTGRAAAVLRALEGPSPAHPTAEVSSVEPAALVERDGLAPGALATGSPESGGLREDSARDTGGTGAPLTTSVVTGGAGAGSRGQAGWLGRHRRKVLSAVGVLFVLGGVLWAVFASSSPRQAGQTITGQQVGAASQINSQERKLLLAAQKAADQGDNVTELKDAQAILAGDPTQPQALTMEGWLLAETGQKQLVTKGLGLLSLAEEVDPGFAQPHVYRGIALLSEGNNRAAVPELRWYLRHKPDPKLEPKVRAALAKAEAALAKSKH